MKIAHLIQQLYTNLGGLQVCVHNISQRHSKNGVDVHVFCTDSSNKPINIDYSVHNFTNFRGINFLYPISKYMIIYNIKRIQDKYKFDLWQINGGYPYGAFLADFFKNNNIPCVLRCSGDDIQIDREIGYGVRRNKKINNIILKNYYKYPAAIAITETVKQEYLDLKLPLENINLIPNGVDNLRLQKNSVVDIRKKHNISNDSKIILSVGRNHPKKGYSRIPSILRKVLSSGVNAYWIVIGKNCSNMKMEKDFNSLKERIILIEEIDCIEKDYNLPPENLISYYQSADIFAMTSLMETFGIVLVEALAAGLPIVCFNSPGVRDVMKNYCGSICSINDLNEFANSIVSIVKKPDLKELKERCIEYSLEFSWDKIAQKYMDLYSELIKKK